MQRKRSGDEFGKIIKYPGRKKQKHIESANAANMDNTKRIRFDDGRRRGSELNL